MGLSNLGLQNLRISSFESRGRMSFLPEFVTIILNMIQGSTCVEQLTPAPKGLRVAGLGAFLRPKPEDSHILCGLARIAIHTPLHKLCFL
jgi:hypothetical protein